MREVACFLSPALYKANYPSFVEGLRKNDMDVKCFDVFQLPPSGYTDQVREHNLRLAAREGCFCQQLQSQQQQHQQQDEGHPQHDTRQKEDFDFLCMAFEDSRQGVRAARAAGMCVVGIGCNQIERDRLRAQGAHAVAGSIAELLQNFHVRNYYQVQYLPYAIYLRDIVEKKVGYPVSLLDTLHGRFVKIEAGSETCIEDDETDEDEEKKEFDANKADREPICCVELDNHANRLIPRDVLGIEPGSLADVYINNVGWPADRVPSIHFNSRGLEMDVIRIFGKYYRVSNGSMRGFVTSGGTEGNFTGLWWQRDYLKRLSNGLRPLLLASDETHYSVAKAAQQLDIDSRSIATLATGEIDCDELARILDEIISTDDEHPCRPVLMVVNAGTTQTGAIDNLPMIHHLMIDKISSRGGHFSIHMDAALMGAVLPIVNPFGVEVDYFSDLGVDVLPDQGQTGQASGDIHIFITVYIDLAVDGCYCNT